MKRKIQLLVLAAAMSLNFSVPVLAEDIEGIQSEETFEAGFESRSVIIENEPSENGSSENETFGNEPSDEDGMDDGQEDESIDGEVTEKLPNEGFFSGPETEESFDEASEDESEMEGETSDIAMFAAAASGSCGTDVKWAYSNGTLKITGTGAMTDYSRWSAAPWYSYREQITKIVISEGITYIGNRAFISKSCEKIYFPSTLTGVGSNSLVFEKLTAIEIPQSLTDITNLSWNLMPGLKCISVADGNTVFSAVNGVLFSGKTLVHYPCAKSDSSYVVPDGITALENRAFSDAANLQQISLPDSLTKIGDYAFADTVSLAEITIPSNVNTLGDYVFFHASALSKVTFLGSSQMYATGNSFSNCSVKTICGYDDASIYYKSSRKTLTLANLASNINASYASLGYARGEDKFCSWELNKDGELRFTPKQMCAVSNRYLLDTYGRIKKVVIEDGFTSIAQNAFSNLRSLEEVVIPDSVTFIDYTAFSNCQSLKKINLPDSITEIRGGAFCKCSSLETITIPNSVLIMGESVFEECRNLTSVTLSENLTEIPYRTFAYCTKLSTVIIPGKVETIGVSAFFGAGLTDIEIPETVREIKGNAFWGNSSLTKIGVPNGVVKIGEYAFSDCASLWTISLPSTVTEIGGSVFYGCKDLRSISLDQYNQNFTSYKGALFNKDKTVLLVYPAGGTGSYTVPDGCKVIGESAFAYSKLTEIVIPEGVTEISDSAFYRCSELAQISLPTSLKSIGKNAFGYSGLKYINILEGVTSIGESAFYESEIYVIELPRTLNFIGDRAFISRNLKDVVYSGTEAEWGNISVDYSVNPYLKNATKHYAVVASGKCGDSAYWYLDQNYVLTIAGSGCMIMSLIISPG